MIGKGKAKKVVDFIMGSARADEVEVIIFENEQALTRFANNHIHQNVKESNIGVSIRVVMGKKIGSASTNSLELKRLKQTLRWAENIARLQKDNPDFKSLPDVPRGVYKKIKTYYPETARFSSMQRARAVSEIIDVAKNYSLNSYGSISNGSTAVCVGNSHGTFAYAVCDDIFCNIVMAGKNSSGYVQAGSRNIDDLNFSRLAETAAQKALKSEDPIDFPPGQYTTIFEPLAAHEFWSYMGYYSFNGKLFNEGRSYLKGRIGKQIIDKRITMVDDPFNPRGFPFPFDFEGVPKRRLTLINKGIAKNVVHDSLSAAAANTESTGHGLSAPNPFGPIPMHLIVRGGDKSLDRLIGETKRGILVTRFHYTNMIDPYKLVFTGMTRDGTFLIEDGRIVRGLKNLRFTENIIDALNRVAGLSKRSYLVAMEPGYGGRFGMGVITPVIKIKDFTFTSATEF